jgi:hypothetical protein
MCWYSHRSRFEHEPQWASEPADTEDLRIADSDRDRAIAQLSKHAGAGRLTLDEFEARAEAVYAAKTYADLRPVFVGLPKHDVTPPVPRPRQRLDARGILRPVAMLALFAWAVIALGAWVLWIGLWLVVPRLVWGRGRRVHPRRTDIRDTSGRLRDERLTHV